MTHLTASQITEGYARSLDVARLLHLLDERLALLERDTTLAAEITRLGRLPHLAPSDRRRLADARLERAEIDLRTTAIEDQVADLPPMIDAYLAENVARARAISDRLTAYGLLALPCAFQVRPLPPVADAPSIDNADWAARSEHLHLLGE